MAINKSQPPDASVRALEVGIGQLQSMSKAPSMALMSGGSPQVSHAHEVFTLGLDDVLSGAGLESTMKLGWRYLLRSPIEEGGLGGAPIVAADVIDQDGGEPRFGQLHQGWISQATQKTIEYAETLPEIASGAYQLRTLHVPALLLDVIWLKDTNGDDDLMIPIASKNPGFKPLEVLGASTFLTRARELAAKKPVFDDRPANVTA